MDSAVSLGRSNGNGKKRHGKAVALVSNLRDSSKAKAFCRDYIRHLVAEDMASSLATIGPQLVNEYLVLKDIINDLQTLRFTGISANSKLIDDARNDYPEDHWCIHDVARQNPDSRLQSDIVYSQHLLELCPGLDPALSNMLSITRRVYIHIFSLAPRKDELIQWHQYPAYQNYYSAAHIRKILCAHRFDAKMLTFVNDDLPGFGEGVPPREVVLIALKKEDSEARPEFEYDAIPELTRDQPFKSFTTKYKKALMAHLPITPVEALMLTTWLEASLAAVYALTSDMLKQNTGNTNHNDQLAEPPAEEDISLSTATLKGGIRSESHAVSRIQLLNN